MKKLLLTAMTAFTLTFCASAERPVTQGATLGEWTMDFPAALELAKTSGKPIFVNFTGSDWCGWCQLMDRLVFTQDAWKAWAKENLVLVYLDYPRDKTLVPEANKALNDTYLKKYDVQGFPSYFILDSEGNTIGRTGANRNATPESFVEHLESVLIPLRFGELLSKEDNETYAQLQAAMKAMYDRREAWQAEVRKQAEAFQKEEQGLADQISELKIKAQRLAAEEEPRPTAED